MKPKGLSTKIFLDSGDPGETASIIKILGYLDGQTTNPTLVSKNPAVMARFEIGEKFTEKQIYEEYQRIIHEISSLIPNGSVSIEVYANQDTQADSMFKQASELYAWVPNAHIKYPITVEGLKAAHKSVQQGIRINMTLCFSQQQAASVYAATVGASPGGVFISPFIGRLDDIGLNGTDIISNILKMYRQGDNHVEVLAASVRSIDHFMLALAAGTDIITAPFLVLKEWAENGQPLIDSHLLDKSTTLRPIQYENVAISNPWQSYIIEHELTSKGIDKFTNDWEALLK